MVGILGEFKVLDGVKFIFSILKYGDIFYCIYV